MCCVAALTDGVGGEDHLHVLEANQVEVRVVTLRLRHLRYPPNYVNARLEVLRLFDCMMRA